MKVPPRSSAAHGAHRPPILRAFEDDEIAVDLFAGGGGASEGFAQALGRSPTVAINHDPVAIAMHAANHPDTLHLCGDVWSYDPRAVCKGRRVGALWASPDCKHFSKAKNGPPVRSKKIRSLAWVVVKWARLARPRVIMLENVEEFQDWGPLLADGTPCPERKGLTFRRWVSDLRREGYEVEWRELRACDYGAPTSRKRLFLIARCDGRPITWPAPTHGKYGARPWRTAAECIDWSVPCPSIFGREKPLVEATLRRIARGVQKHVVEDPEPFVVNGAAHTLIQTSWGERVGQAPRVPGLHKPIGTQVAGGVKHALVSAFLTKNYGGHEGRGATLRLPMSTITTRDHHALTTAFLIQYNGTSESHSLRLPLGTLTTHDRFGLVRVAGEHYQIADIGMRMLVPREQFRAQGFRDDYVIDPVVDGERIGTTHQTRCAGNSVPPDVVRELVSANVPRKEVVAA